METTVKTAYGEVPLEKLLAAYTQQQEARKRKKEWMQTEEGKEYNRQKSKNYYALHKEEIAQKRADKYGKEREDMNAKAKEYYNANREICIARQKAYRDKKAKARGEESIQG
jgi:hypothetical protein